MMDDMFSLLVSRRTEVPAGGIAEDNDRTNHYGKDEQAWQEGEKKEMKKKKKKKKKEKKKKKKKKKKEEKKMKGEKKNKKKGQNKRMTPIKEELEEVLDEKEGGKRERKVEDPLKQSTPMPLTDPSNAAIFIRGSQAVLEEAHGSDAGVFLDLCCGKGGVGKRAEAVHGQKVICVDLAGEDPAIIKCDLADPTIRTYIKREIIDRFLKKKSSVAGMLHIPCETFSSARHGKPGGRTPVPLRDYGKNVWGLPGLTPQDQAKLEQGNRIARALLGIRDDLKNMGAPAGIENGDMSMLWKVPEMGAEDATVLKVCYCMMGKEFRKRTRLLVWNAPSPRILEDEVRRGLTKYWCNSPNGMCRRTGQPHVVLRGWARGKALTKQGERYPKKFVNMIARILCSPAEPAA